MLIIFTLVSKLQTCHQFLAEVRAIHYHQRHCDSEQNFDMQQSPEASHVVYTALDAERKT